jgi:Holliday junction resolvasome RuvABC endonuclease subunit
MILSLDISTSVIGLALFNESGDKLEELSCVKFKNKISLFEKLEAFGKEISHIIEHADVKYIVIEEPLKKFMGKFSNADTIAKLNFFNGMISGYLYDKFKVQPIYYNVNSARKTVFPDVKFKREGNSTKHQVWSLVKDMEPQINWKYSTRTGKLMDTNYDMADAYVVGMAFIVDLDKTE